jgi:hypothetical protein
VGDAVAGSAQSPAPGRFITSFLNSFQRGNRDTVQREQAGSILMMTGVDEQPDGE